MAKIADVQEVSLWLIKPYEKNAKIHGDYQIQKLKDSIREFGFVNPCLIDRDYNLIAGHGRVKAAEQLGMETVPCLFIEGLTEAQRRAYILADNRLSELGEWDMEIVDEELAELSAMDFDISLTGFDFEMDSPEVEEDDYEEPEHIEPKAKRGDIYQLGRHRLMCGDSTDPAVIDRLMDGVKADMVFTDPPYGMNLDTDFSKMHSENNHDFQASKKPSKGGKYQKGKVDEFHPEMINAIFEIDADEMFLWGADYYAELLPNKNDGSWIVWDKRMNESDELVKNQNAMDKGYGSCFELCWSKKKHKREIARVKWSGLFGMEKEDTKKRVHPTQKPNVLAKWFIEKYSKKGDLIVDIFGGSGSTLIACEQLNRKCYMCELDPHYVDVIIDRWETLTGETAVLLNE